MAQLSFSNSVGLIVFGLTLNISSAVGQTSNDFEARRTAAYQKFHQGKAFTAAHDLQTLVDQSTDDEVKANLLRDITEICATARDFDCSLKAEVAAFEIAKWNEKLKFMIPELFAYLLHAQVWFGNNDVLEKQTELNGFINTTTPMTNPKASSIGNIALQNYFVSKGDFRRAENCYSSILLSLLMFDPKNTYDISRTLVKMIGILISQQDLVGAVALSIEADSYLTKNLNHQSILWAEYKLNAAQLLAFLNKHQFAAVALAESSALIEPLEVTENAKTYYLASNNSLLSLALLLDGKLDEATKAHSQSPMQVQRSAIVSRGEFQTFQEMYFALSDLIISSAKNKSNLNFEWEPLFRKPLKWKLDAPERNNTESYRQFALAILTAAKSDVEAAPLFQSSALLRVENFEATLKGKFEGFQLPSSIDLFIIAAGISSAIRQPEGSQFDLMLRGGEMLSRTLRQQLSDFAVLIGSQKTDSARNAARSSFLLIRQKRDWEIQQIHRLLAGEALERGPILNTYAQLVGQVNKLKETFTEDPIFSKTVGYPTVSELQQTLHSEEVFVSYFPTYQGLGKLCVNKNSALVTTAKFDPSEITLELKVLRQSLIRDNAPDKLQDAHYPVKEAIHLNDVLFGGLEKCIAEGALINVALPEDVAGIPLAALLRSEPPKLTEGFDLRRADWLGNHFSFSISVSARHLMGTHQPNTTSVGLHPYLGVGDPNLAPSDLSLIARGISNTSNLEDKDQLSRLLPLPETKSELLAVGSLLGASETEILLGSKATEENFRSKELGTYDVIHFATHGLFKDDLVTLKESALVLTAVDATDNFNNGLLTASEITRLSLNARLVVLSACNTGRFDSNLVSNSMNDLQAAFSIAGANTLLGSLWSVDTYSAHDLVINFFKAWSAKQEKSASRALSSAAREYLKTADDAHQHPRFWAPFVVFGYGDKIPAALNSSAKTSLLYRTLREDAGEILDAKSFGKNIVYSMLGSWNGSKMASIIGSISPSGRISWEETNHQIGASRLVVARDKAYALGYQSRENATPTVRAFDQKGQIMWQHNYADISGTFLDGSEIDSDVVFLAYGMNNNDVTLVKSDQHGKEIGRAQIPGVATGLLAGQKAFIARAGQKLVVAINGQTQAGLEYGPKSDLGLPTWCLGKVTTSLHRMTKKLTVEKQQSIDDFQVYFIASIKDRLLLGGSLRGRCDQSATAAIISVDDSGGAAVVWKDSDPFGSYVQSISSRENRLLALIKRQRPIGIGILNAKVQEGYSKRWGDDGARLEEYSLIELDSSMKKIRQDDSSFGLSVFPQGLLATSRGVLTFGGAGGRPAISQSP